MLVGMFMLFAAGEPAEKTIVVEGRRTEQALTECLARKCDVREDALAAIRHAQTQFADGHYADARKTLLASLRRNGRAADRDPRAVSALWHALARVSLHDGDMIAYRRAALRSANIMAGSSAVTPAERVRGEVQLADAHATTGDVEGAVRRYRAVGDAARAGGDRELAEMMRLRAIYARSGFDGRPAARRALERAAQEQDMPARARLAALSLAAQLQDDKAASARFLESVPVQPADAPTTLLFAPADKLAGQRDAVNRAVANGDSTLLNLLQARSNEARPYQWADIGFWIRPDGRVAEAELLRSSGLTRWDDVVQTVRGRRYAPYEADQGSSGRYKVERVTLTYEKQTPTGSLIRRRAGLPSYRFEELKIEQPDRTGG